MGQSLCASVTVWMHVWVVVSQTLIVLSHDADIKQLILKERQRDVTVLVCPCNVAMHVLVAVSHTLMVLSQDPEYSLLPSSETITQTVSLHSRHTFKGYSVPYFDSIITRSKIQSIGCER
jgi:hypothetical protein